MAVSVERGLAAMRPTGAGPPALGATGSHDTIVVIQYLRGVAASLIVIFHAMSMFAVAPYLGEPIGSFGVDIFFVISGFIMWTTTADGRQGVRRFWLARITRIVPIYWFFTSLSLAILSIVPQTAFHPRDFSPLFLLKSYFFIPTFNPVTADITPVYTLGWTLNYEMFFYFLFGWCLLVRPTAMRLSCLAAALGGFVALGLLDREQSAMLDTYTDPLVLEFLAGAVLAIAAPRLQRMPAWLGAALVVAGCAQFAVTTAINPQPRIVAWGVAAVLVVAGSLAFERLARQHASRWALLLGDASYSIYLAHPFPQRAWYFVLLAVRGPITGIFDAVIYAVGAFVTGLLGGVVAYLLIERPALKLRRWSLRRA